MASWKNGTGAIPIFVLNLCPSENYQNILLSKNHLRGILGENRDFEHPQFPLWKVAAISCSVYFLAHYTADSKICANFSLNFCWLTCPVCREWKPWTRRWCHECVRTSPSTSTDHTCTIHCVHREDAVRRSRIRRHPTACLHIEINYANLTCMLSPATKIQWPS